MKASQTKRCQRRNARATRPVWLDIDQISFLAENWSLGGLFVLGHVSDHAQGDKVQIRLSLNPLTGSPFAYVTARVVRRDELGSAYAFCDLPAPAFDLFTEAIYRRPPLRSAGLVDRR